MTDGTAGGADDRVGDAADGDDPDVDTLIMEATFRALRTHGYADLSIAHIAEEFEKSKSLLYYHYDSKDDLLAGFLEFAGDRFLTMLAEAERDADDPVGTLRALVDIYLAAEVDEEMAEAQRAIIDLRAQAVSEPRFREEFTRIDWTLRTRLVSAVADGVDAGVFPADLDPETAGSAVLSMLTGAMLQRHTADAEAVSSVRSTIHGYLDDLVADGRDDDAGA